MKKQEIRSVAKPAALHRPCRMMTALVSAFAMSASSVVANPVPGVALPPSAQVGGSETVPYPQPRYAVDLEKDVRIPMRDGIGLYADIYKPRGVGDRLPTILIVTPYSKAPYRESRLNTYKGVAHMFASQGFAVAVADMRGRFRSEGMYFPAGKDVNGDDGYDIIGWLASQPWSNGKVGGYGCSELGGTQASMATLKPLALAAIVPMGASGALRNMQNENQQFGVPKLSMLKWFASIDPGHAANGSSQSTSPDGSQQPRPPAQIDYDRIFRTLPIADMADRAGLKHPDAWREWMTHEPGDPWHLQFPFIDENSRPNVPALWVGSWYDKPDPMLELFNRFKNQSTSEQARGNQYAIVSATDHCRSETGHAPYIAGQKNGQRDVGDVRLDYWSAYLRWYNHWLRDGQGDFSMPHVQYYLMGANRWKSAESWPLPGTRFVPYYFSSGGHANTSRGDGKLSTAMATGPYDHYRYDPADPTPDAEGGSASNNPSEVDLRSDRLVFTSEPLRSGMEVTGPLRAVLYVSSSAVDTDFVVQLSDVYPDGRVYKLAHGVVRARYRDAYAAPSIAQEDYRHPSLLTPGKVYRIEAKFGATGNWFGPGHRIRVQVSSAMFPAFAPNLNTGGNNSTETTTVVAENRIYHDRDHPSHIILPVVPPAIGTSMIDSMLSNVTSALRRIFSTASNSGP